METYYVPHLAPISLFHACYISNIFRHGTLAYVRYGAIQQSRVKFAWNLSCFEVKLKRFWYNKLYQRTYNTIFKKISRNIISDLGQRKSQDKFWWGIFIIGEHGYPVFNNNSRYLSQLYCNNRLCTMNIFFYHIDGYKYTWCRPNIKY